MKTLALLALLILSGCVSYTRNAPLLDVQIRDNANGSANGNTVTPIP